MVNARLAQIGLPDFGMPGSRPEIPEATYAARIGRLRLRAEEGGYDRLVVYADREHSAGLFYLTGFDPRFEEAILVLGPSGDPALLVGNECQGLAAHAPHLVAKINRGDYAGAADELLDINRANGHVLAGLTRRREAERALVRTLQRGDGDQRIHGAVGQARSSVSLFRSTKSVE